MKRNHFYIIFPLFFLCSIHSYSQTDCVTNPPLPPVLKLVSVQPETGNTEFRWTLSPSSGIAAYIVYSYKGSDGMAVDTIWDPSATSYLLSSTVTKYFSVSYVVAAMRLPRCTSIFSNDLNTIFTKTELDTCTRKIVVSWNSYSSIPVGVSDYSILQSVNGGNFTEAGRVSPDITNFTLSDFTTNANYCFVVRANLEGGTFSSSNMSCITTKMQRPPLWINADYATINDNKKVSLSFTIDPSSEITRFRLEKRSGSSTVFNEIAFITAVNGKVLYTDDQADIKVINYYRLSAINNCNTAVLYSNTCSNMVLSLARTGNDFRLSWNSYRKWLGQLSSYRLFVSTGSGFEEHSLIQPLDTVVTIGYRELMYKISGNEVCFYVSVSENANPHGISGLSTSSVACTTPTEIITVPNIFTPDNDLVNDLFKPVLTFTPLDYQLVITDRKGKILFESKDPDEPWDGSLNGNPQPEIVCLWFLRVTTPSGKSISKTGTVTIYRKK